MWKGCQGGAQNQEKPPGLKTLLARLEFLKNRAGVQMQISLVEHLSQSAAPGGMSERRIKHSFHTSMLGMKIGRNEFLEQFLKLSLTSALSPHADAGQLPEITCDFLHCFKEFAVPDIFCFHGYSPEMSSITFQSMLMMEDVVVHL